MAIGMQRCRRLIFIKISGTFKNTEMYKMKSNFLIWVAMLLTGSGLLSGCAKELNQQPQATASQQAVFTSTQGLSLYTQSFYSTYNGTSYTLGDVAGGEYL
jgi:hypothetical protein